MKLEEISEKTKASYERIVESFRTHLNLEGVTILTGNNGSGKSLIRKQLPFKIKEHLGFKDISETKGMVVSTSMDLRTSSNPDWGALSGVMRDTEWIATSQNTLHSIRGLLKSCMESKGKKYIVIDEYEIGCSEETIVSLARLISSEIESLMKEGKIFGAMIITHSRIGMREIKHDYFINLNGLSEEEWLNREIVPTDLDELERNELFFYIREIK